MSNGLTAIRIACPICRAKPGSMCTLAEGVPRMAVHLARRDALRPTAIQNGLRALAQSPTHLARGGGE